MKKRPLLLRPLNKLDNYLLIHKPEIWSARTHLVAWYSILFMLVLGAISFVSYGDARVGNNVGIWVGFVIVIAIIAVVLWIIYLLRFNVFKRYGIIQPAGRLTTFVLYFIASAMIVAYCFVPLAVETLRARHEYTNAELVNDINSINTKICQLEYNTLPKIWNRDSVVVVDTIFGENYNKEGYTDDEVNHNYRIDTTTNSSYRLISKGRLAFLMSEKDSIEKVNDSMYVLYTVPSFNFLSNYVLEEDSSYTLLTSEMIWNNSLRYFSPPDKQAVSKQLNALINKYYNINNNSTYYNENEDEHPTYRSIIEKRYKLSNINNGMHNIVLKINRFSGENGADLFRLWFYFAFSIALLLFIFRHSTVRAFFLSLLSLVVIVIITSLITSFTNASASIFFLWCFFYFIIFSVLGATSFFNKERTVVSGIAINLWILLVPYIPLLITSYYYERKQEQDMVKSILTLNYKQMHHNMLIAEISGQLIFLVLLATYIHKLYKTWYALPEQ